VGRGKLVSSEFGLIVELKSELPHEECQILRYSPLSRQKTELFKVDRTVHKMIRLVVRKLLQVSGNQETDAVFAVVKPEVLPQFADRLRHVAVIMQVDLFILDTAPQAFDKDVVQGAPSAIHTDANAARQKPSGKGRAGELHAPIRIEDLRLPQTQRPL
jgi:hypothetical protein